MKLLRNFSRIFVGLVFVFSGFVKGVDPLGTAYKIEDYFVAYGMQWAEPAALTLSVLLCAFEFSLGILLLLNVRPKFISWLTLLIMVYFTGITFYDALYSPVPDCGCFGDALKLTNWQTFYKNIILVFFALIIFFSRKKYKSPYPEGFSLFLMLLVPLFFVWFSAYNYRNLPMIDFTAWKTGNKMIPDKLEPPQYFLVYENKTTKEQKEYVAKDLPWQDTAWMSQWVFVKQRVDDPNQYPAPNFRILDTASNDLTMSYLQQPGYLVLLVCVEVNKANDKELLRMNDLNNALTEAGYTVLGLSSSSIEDLNAAAERNGLNINWFQSDDTELKTMVRANPGLVILKDATVIKKWHHRNFPDASEIIKNYPVQ
ncbi:MAG: BT_3928 family protein [Bacteroidales bacterium]